MKTKFVLLLFLHVYPTFWCDSDTNVTSDIMFKSKNFLSNHTKPKEVKKISTSITNNNDDVIDDVKMLELGSDILKDLAKEFPTAIEGNIDVNLTQEKEYVVKIVEKEKQEEDNEKNEIQTLYNITAEPPTEEEIIMDMIDQFSKYLEKSGKKSLKTLAYKVKNLVNPILYLNSVLKESNYVLEMNKYLSFIFNRKITCEIDHQFTILDMLESSIKIFGKACEELCGLVVQESNVTLSLNQYDAIEKAIGMAVYDERKNAFDYLCKTTYICRRFPAYSDYIVKLLKLIIRLPDRQFLIVSDIIEDSIRCRAKFMRSLIDDDTARNITKELETIMENAEKITSLMTVFIKNIVQRFKVYYNNGVEIRSSTKAIRIFLDMIDLTYEILTENVIATNFKHISKVLYEWGRGKKRDVEYMLSEFIYDALDFLDNYWNHDIKQEVRVLLQVIVTGSADNDTLWEELFTNGSKIGTNEHVIYTEDEHLEDKYFNVI